jgi:hypothetical protein
MGADCCHIGFAVFFNTWAILNYRKRTNDEYQGRKKILIADLAG